jgi:hypothetical protein
MGGYLRGGIVGLKFVSKGYNLYPINAFRFKIEFLNIFVKKNSLCI